MLKDKKAQTLAARLANRVPAGIVSKAFLLRIPERLVAETDAMGSTRRGEIFQRGLNEFPWDELEELRELKKAIEHLSNSGE